MTVVYYSKTGNTKQMAEVIAESMQSVESVEAKAFPIDAVDEEWIKSKCIVVGTPIYAAGIRCEIKSWLEMSLMKYGAAGKIGGAFATADYI